MNPEKIIPEQKGDIKQEYLNDFVDFRQNYLDDLPPQTIEQDDPNLSKYKCRGNFFFGVCGRISNLINEGIITHPNTLAKARDFIEYAKHRDWKKMSTQVDIDKVNEILDILIQELS
ncbi:MAG: hypothetical protein WC310_05380 [Patescibacteria group bacterium]|jgi:hypothetical protein